LTKPYQFFKKYHKWFALAFTLFFIFFALSGILLNHRTLISGFDVNRKWLPKSYTLQNWNLASVKGGIGIGKDSILFYGGAGIWLTDSTLSKWESFMVGFPDGSDHRKIFDLAKTANGVLFAATRYGLYAFSHADKTWTKLNSFTDDDFIVGLQAVGRDTYVLTRNNLYKGNFDYGVFTFKAVELIPPLGSKPSISIFRLLWVIHSGEVLGIPGRLLVDIGGLVMLFLSITGLVYFFFPKIIKRVKAKSRLSRMKRTTRFSYSWHLKVGILSAVLLLVVSFTGIFLRPPFLLLVVSSEIEQISNPQNVNQHFWHDKLRDIRCDSARNAFLIATSNGVFSSTDGFSTALKPFEIQPPISVMGINVFEVLANGDYLVGSFSGAFRWNPYSGIIEDYFTHEPIRVDDESSSPFGSKAIAGYYRNSSHEYFFDYDKGLFSTTANDFQMPIEVASSFPFPLWNLAQEVHTCRIYSPLISVFYILIVPLAGIAMLLIIISGVLMWFIKRRSQKSEVRSQEPEARNNREDLRGEKRSWKIQSSKFRRTLNPIR